MAGKPEEEEVKDFYKKSGTWEDVLGEHFHHGYYELGSTVYESDSPSAQIRMIDELLKFASVSENEPKSILDVGCGIGGTCRYLAMKYEGAECKGITLSPVEIERAEALNTTHGLQEKISFEVANALALPFRDGQFDLIWCVETAEHISEKDKLVSEMVRVAAPGATIILTTWCHRDLSPSEQTMKQDEEKLIKNICELLGFPPFCSIANYVNIFKSHPLEDIKAEDWSNYAAPFWTAKPVFKRYIALLFGGWEGVKIILAMRKMMEAHKKGLVQLAVISCRKPK